MKYFLSLLCCCSIGMAAIAQPQAPAIELYDLIKKLIPDSTGYENVGDWAVGNPKKYPVKWASDRIIMSDDTAINFYRTGTATVRINGKNAPGVEPTKMNIILKGARSGFSSFALLTPPNENRYTKMNIDSIFGKHLFNATLLKRCDNKPISGFYYYELKIPKKDIAYFKLSWITVNGNTGIRIDCYDSWSRYAAKVDCR